jgi:hypothetical protein
MLGEKSDGLLTNLRILKLIFVKSSVIVVVGCSDGHADFTDFIDLP